MRSHSECFLSATGVVTSPQLAQMGCSQVRLFLASRPRCVRGAGLPEKAHGSGDHVDVVGAVEDEVRELVRRRGLDPLTDPVSMRALVSEVVADYEERSLGGGVVPLTDPAAAHREVLDAVAGFGPLQVYLDDPEIEEIWIKNPEEYL